MSEESVPAFDKERWLRLSALLDEGLELDGVEREAWLERLRSEDSALAGEVAALLVEHGALSREGFLDGTAAEPPAASTLAGLVVGAYTLRSPLGQGGMGSVWLAERSDGRFTGRAAVKLLNASLIGREGEARFKREGSILARLRHPNIAHLADAGISSLGQPYIILEYVDGMRIDRFCEERGLSLQARLGVFLEVLEAVAHAHANLIVHRDLKPQNVLVDRDGRVRLLDFGIAKLIDPEPGDPATVTRAGESALTPEYAAPEQVTGGLVTTATDIFSLGALLCVLLTGQHPAGSSPRTPAEWVKAITEVEPKPLSALAAESGQPKIAAALRGDLDNIAARAMKKNPAERYPSVEAFADDLRRHLRHEPVSARADSMAYRASKFVRRHPLGVVAASAAILGTIVFTAGIAWQAREARRQRDETRLQMARATAAREFMSFLLGVASSPGSGRTSSDLLAQGEAVIHKEYAGNDTLQAELLVTIGEQYMASERYERAAPILHRAAGLARRSGDPDLQARALCPLALLHAINDEQEEAESMMDGALGNLPDDSLHAMQRAECLATRGNFGFWTEDAEQMKRDATAALALLDTISIPADTTRISAQGVLAYGHYLARESRQADEAYTKLVSTLERAGRDKTLLAADVYNNWSLVHYQGDIAKAEPLCRKAVELRREIEGRDGIAPSVTYNLAGVLLQLARYDEAEELYDETIRTARARKEARIETDAMLERSELYVDMGDLKRAAAQLEDLGPLLTGPDPEPFRVVQMAYYRGRLLLAQGQPAEARASLGSAVDVFERRKSRIALFVFSLIGMSRADIALDDTAAAEEEAGRALEVAESMANPEMPSYLIGLALAARADAHLAAGEDDKARADYVAALPNLETTLGGSHPAAAAAREALSRLGSPRES